jgi:hypothetical protein
MRKPPERVTLAYRTKHHAMSEWSTSDDLFKAQKVEYVRADIYQRALDELAKKEADQ